MNPKRRHHAVALSLFLACANRNDTVETDLSEATESTTTGTSNGPVTPDETGDPDDPSTTTTTTGAEPTSTDGSTSTGVDESTSGESEGGTTEGGERIGCDDDEVCTPTAPAGWSGPSAIYRGADAPPDCPDELPTIAFEANDDLVAPAPTCTCSCGKVTNAVCRTVVRENGTQCLNLQFNLPSWNVTGNQCLSISTNATALRSDQPILDTSNASCSVNPGENVPNAAFATRVKGCELPEPAGACEDDGQCLPVAPDPWGEVCIYAEGDYACPAGPFSERTLLHTDFEDTRGCTDCSCTDPTGTCSGTVRYQSACVGDLIGIYASGPVGTCQTMLTAPNAVLYQSQMTVSCQPEGGAPEGQATPTNPITLCCMP
jgi:hypothetical protein